MVGFLTIVELDFLVELQSIYIGFYRQGKKFYTSYFSWNFKLLVLDIAVAWTNSLFN